MIRSTEAFSTKGGGGDLLREGRKDKYPNYERGRKSPGKKRARVVAS